MSKHRLYFSTQCRFCQGFLEELSATPFVPEFQLICVDKNAAGVRPTLPPWLKSVPSLMVAGETTPRVGPGPVNNWLFERKLGASGGTKNTQQAIDERNQPLALPVYSPDIAPRPNATSRTATPAKMPDAVSGSTRADPSMSPPGAVGAGGEGPSAYHSTEMSGTKWSDAYSFLGGPEFTSDKGYDPISRNFESLIGPGPTVGGGGSGGGGGGGGPKRSAKEDELLRQFESFSKARDMDIPGPTMRK